MDDTLSKKFAQQLQDKLAELEDLESTATAAMATVDLDQTRVGRLSRMDAMQAQQMAIASQQRRKTEILQIKMALKRVKEGEFGYCLCCGEEIAPARLAINPAATLCIRCAA